MLIQHLQKVFAERSRKNPQYSLRAFAVSLDIDSSTLSALLRGKRPLTTKMACKLIEKLDMQDPLQTQNLLLSTLGNQVPQEFIYSELEMVQAEVLASWEHFAILALLELPKFKGDTRHIAQRLNIPIGIAMEALHRLEKSRLVQKQNGNWKLTGKNMATPSNIPNAAIRAAHRQHLEKAIESLEKHSVEIRDISGITMAINSSKVTEAKKLIADFRRRLSAFLETGSQDSVYRLNVQLFPLSQEPRS